MTGPRPPAPQPLTARPLSIATCSWDTLVAELGDPFAAAPRTGPLPGLPTAAVAAAAARVRIPAGQPGAGRYAAPPQEQRR